MKESSDHSFRNSIIVSAVLLAVAIALSIACIVAVRGGFLHAETKAFVAAERVPQGASEKIVLSFDDGSVYEIDAQLVVSFDWADFQSHVTEGERLTIETTDSQILFGVKCEHAVYLDGIDAAKQWYGHYVRSLAFAAPLIAAFAVAVFLGGLPIRRKRDVQVAAA